MHTQGNQKIWDKLLIHTNSMQDLMLLVFLDCTNDKLKQVCEDMKIFFTSGEGMKYNIASVYIRDMNKYVQSLLFITSWLGIKQYLVLTSDTYSAPLYSAIASICIPRCS